MPAYAITEEPEPGSTDVLGSRLPPEQAFWTPLKVWLPRELVAELVRDVVDREEVALRLRQAGAATALVVPADHAEERDAAAVDAEADVADVVVGRADQLAEHGAVAAERADVAEVELAVLVGRRVVRVGDRVEARVRAARTVGPGAPWPSCRG